MSRWICQKCREPIPEDKLGGDAFVVYTDPPKGEVVGDQVEVFLCQRCYPLMLDFLNLRNCPDCTHREHTDFCYEKKTSSIEGTPFGLMTTCKCPPHEIVEYSGSKAK